MTTYKSLFASYKWGLDAEPDAFTVEVAEPDAFTVEVNEEEGTDVTTPLMQKPYLEFDPNTDLPRAYVTPNGKIPLLIILAERLKPDDQMVWTDADGTSLPPLTISKALVGQTLGIHRAGDTEPFTWRIRPSARVAILDNTPKFNEWGEESL